MKRLLMATMALAMLGGAAYAGPNAGGTLILSANPGIVVSSDPTNYCGQSGIPNGDCHNAINSIPGNDVAFNTAWFVVAAFAPSSSPRLAGVVFGWSYGDNVVLTYHGGCGDFALPTGAWPASGEGIAITWNTAQTSLLTDVYYVAGYGYGSDCSVLQLQPHPTQPPQFADDDTPANLDDIAGFGSLGFNCPGQTPCPDIPPPPRGACCLPDFGPCVVVEEAECALAGGAYQGNDSVCEPNPCPPAPGQGACCIGLECSILTAEQCEAANGDYKGDDSICEPDTCEPIIPTEETTWGSIKNHYR